MKIVFSFEENSTFDMGGPADDSASRSNPKHPRVDCPHAASADLADTNWTRVRFSIIGMHILASMGAGEERQA
jgi:hypothetical protein